MCWRDGLIEKSVGSSSLSGVSNSGSNGLGRLSCGGRLGGSILGASVGLCVGGSNGLV